MSPSGEAAFAGGDFRLEELTGEGAGWTATVAVPESCRWFEGHFPSEPILPGVGQLEVVAALVRRLHGADGGADWECGGISNLRLSGQVRPGDRLVVDLRTEGDRTVFALRSAGDDSSADSGGKRISNGIIFGSPDPDAAAPDHESPTGAGELGVDRLDPSRLLPHGPPSLLALEVIGLDPGSEGGPDGGDGDGGPAILCRGRVSGAHPAARDGLAGAWMAIELAAQAAGLLQAANRPDNRRASPAIGYLVRVREARFTTGHLPVDADLLARTELAGRNGPLSLYRATVGIPGGFALATASLGTYVAEG